MTKKTKINLRLAVGIMLGVMIIGIALFSRLTGGYLAANSGNYVYGTSNAPGCGSTNCLTIPSTETYNGITVNTTIRSAILKWTNFALGFLALIATVILIYAGFLYVTAAGEKEQADKAKKTIMWVVIGIIVILVAYALVNTLITKGPTGRDY
ncbi:MAG: hypothetical protein V1936_02815 [Patescibacteria group bacterium]